MLQNSKMQSRRHWKLSLIIGVLILSNTILAVIVIRDNFIKTQQTVPSENIRLVNPEKKLIAPLLLSGDHLGAEDYTIEDTLKLLTYDLLNNRELDTISIYYRNPKTGSWAGVAQNTEYDPASLLKVPMMIAWYKKAESDPKILSQKIQFKNSTLGEQGLAFNQLEPNVSYTFDDLIKIMITKSDNDALTILHDNIDTSILNQVYTDLGIKPLNDTEDTIHISPYIYARFIRVLYNATYLNDEYSEKALELLTEADFTNGLVAGVSKNILVAHKFGSFQTSGTTASRELHDCGIIYHPKNPYILCVMTKGSVYVSQQTFESAIQKISKTVYDIVDKK